MSLSRVFVILPALFHVIHVVSGSNVHITCPRIPGSSTNSQANLLPFESHVQSTSLNSSCFGISIALTVENILPDPSYISRETNLDIIASALQNTLKSHSIDVLHIAPIHNEAAWSVVNQCPQKADSSVNKFYLETFSLDIPCAEKSLKVVDEYMQCEFETPSSIAYQFTLQSMSTKVDIIQSTKESVSLNAEIYDTSDLLLRQTNVQIITNQNPNQEFIFDDLTLTPNTVYTLKINIVSATAAFDSTSDSLPVITTSAAPNACQLGHNIHGGDDNNMLWALSSFCDAGNSEKLSLFEQTAYQKHSSQIIIPEAHLRRRLTGAHLEARDRWKPSPVAGTKCLYKLYPDGTYVQIADDAIAPFMTQCIAVDPDTKRIFNVGGEENGAAVNRLVVHQIDVLGNVQIVGTLSMDRARSSAMCHYWRNKRDNEEYVIVINGMNEADDRNVDHWFNDIVFVPLNPQNEQQFPPITLEHNVVDMRTYVTDSDQLYLVGGRDGYNAINYIQSIDLERVLDSALLNNGEVLRSVDRMEPMALDLVLPFVDLVQARNKTCLMIFGGQKRVNNAWVDTKLPAQELQLICNDYLKMNVAPVDIPAMNYFTAFDEAHLQKVDSFLDYKDTENVFLSDYNFEDDDIWYEFSGSFKICAANDVYFDEEHLIESMNALEVDNGLLRDNILSASQEAFKEWNDGYSDLNIAEINFIRPSSADGSHCVGLSHSVCDGLRISGNGGDQECGYNAINGDCYAIKRVAAQSVNNDVALDEHEAVFGSLVQSSEFPLIVESALLAIILGLVVVIYAICRKNQKLERVHDGVKQQMNEVEIVNGIRTSVAEMSQDEDEEVDDDQVENVMLATV